MKKNLNGKPDYPLEEGIKITYDWINNQYKINFNYDERYNKSITILKEKEKEKEKICNSKNIHIQERSKK